MTTSTDRWIMECDGEIELHPSRTRARAAARWHAGHPANANIRAFGPYRNASGHARVIDRIALDEAGHLTLLSVRAAITAADRERS